MTTFTNSKLTDEYVSNATLIRLILWADQHNSHYVVAALRELQERRKADSAEPGSQTYKLPVNTPCQDAPAHIWLQTAGVWPEDGELSELTWCSHNQHHDDTLYVRADLVNGNYPATPDGWISCSERMPEKYDFDIWVFSPSRGVLDGLQWDGSMFTDDEYQFVIHDATHWMRKVYPAAPQQDGE
ncbi:DUF551 domain-containing protein [Escherichia coli O157:H7]|uniref:DUF551 domain-containing protein n=8 Tax=Escherichia coli TaxID=562 RepID=UPI00028C1D97|nr:DUF551 domain-containing protein [Escherichia coli]EED1212189.1 DUF551 domain-containing protein [Escherichia coli]EEQ8078427.1 DUF551 domain-containing protein [Escherichia coli]EER5374089.1 DUF551 domain-containing protein [Escherichia coli]EER9214010.1 DUF551 domain-containing protein [Escherichia coli]EER9529646.1 DUF551 domain-containing protein [Escherichia coli]